MEKLLIAVKVILLASCVGMDMLSRGKVRYI